MASIAACIAIAVLYFADPAFRTWADNPHNLPIGGIIGVVLAVICLKIDRR